MKHLYDDLNQEEYSQLYEVLRDSVKVIRARYSAYVMSGMTSVKHMSLIRAQRVIAERNDKKWRVPRDKIYRMIREARRAMGNPAMSKLRGVIIVNDIFDMIDNISGTKPADLESAMLELKDTIRNMSRLNDEAKAVSDKCEIIASNISNICSYVAGDTDELTINNGCKHNTNIARP